MTANADEQVRAALTGPTLPELLEIAAERRGDEPYATYAGVTSDLASFIGAVAAARRGLAALGVQPGDRVAVLLPNHLDHVVLVHALIGMRAVWVPVNPKLRGDPLTHLLTDSDPQHLLVDAELLPSIPVSVRPTNVVKYTVSEGPPWHHSDTEPTLPELGQDDVVAIMYTSGTTGPAKGVQVTDRMLRAAALGVAEISEPDNGDVFLIWEPLCHVGGAQVLFLPLFHRVRLALVDRFSASGFWAQVGDAGATHVHHLGGIMPMLLSRPPSADERTNPVRVAWGGGMTEQAWTEAEHRFGLQVRECYGMTEAASISTVNRNGVGEGIGRAVPWFDVQVHDDTGSQVPEGVSGEIVVRPLVDGLVTPGYFRRPDATAAARRDAWWRTGDRGRFVDGALQFVGRLSDSVRHRGENVSAWEVEAVVNTYPEVAESAVVGVPAAEGEENIKVFVTLADPGDGVEFDAGALVDWCGERLAAYQVPRYVAVVDSFAKTPSLRVQKASLATTTDDSYDACA